MGKKAEIVHSYSHTTNFTPFQSHWVPQSCKVISHGQSLAGRGKLLIQQLKAGFSTENSQTQPLLQTITEVEKPSPIRCGSFGLYPVEHRYFITGQFDGCTSIWDLSIGFDLPVWTSKSSKIPQTSLVNTISTPNNPQRPEFVTTARNGHILLWDARTPSPVLSFKSNKQIVDCWSVIFDKSDENILYGGYQNGNLCCYDLRAGLIWLQNLNNNGICYLDIGEVKNGNDNNAIPSRTLLCSCLNSQVVLFNTHSDDPSSPSIPLSSSQTNISRNEQSTMWCSRYIPQHRGQFVTCTGNGKINLYSQSLADNLQVNYEALAMKQVSDCGVIHLDWSDSKDGLFCFACLDNSINIGFVVK